MKKVSVLPSRHQGKTNATAPKPKVKPEADFPRDVVVGTFTDVMVDLETLGSRPGCAILSIGAVAFGPEGFGPEFYAVVSRPAQKQLGLHEDPATIDWWSRQSVEAQAVLRDAASDTAVPLAAVLKGLNLYLAQFGVRDVKVWGNGSDFDNAILSCCYGAVEQAPGWKFWNNRCYLTLKNLYDPGGAKLNRTGTYHNALDDAKTQALHAIQLLWPTSAP